MGRVICGDECDFDAQCERHQGIFALTAWVDEGLVGDWAADVGSEPLNHRTMMKHSPIGHQGRPTAMGWLDLLAVIVRRFSYWLGLDD